MLHDMLKLHEADVFQWLVEHIGMGEEAEDELEIEDSGLSNGSAVVPEIKLNVGVDTAIAPPIQPEDTTVNSIEQSGIKTEVREG